MDGLMTLLIPVVATFGGRYVYEAIQILGTFINTKVPTVLHAIALVFVQWGLIVFAQFIGIPMPETLQGFTPELTTAIVSALAAMGWHAIDAKKAKAAVT